MRRQTQLKAIQGDSLCGSEMGGVLGVNITQQPHTTLHKGKIPSWCINTAYFATLLSMGHLILISNSTSKSAIILQPPPKGVLSLT